MLVGAGIILLTVASVLGTYFAARRVLGPEPDDRTRDLASSVLFRISALHGLVLALVFASEVVEYNQLSFESAAEVNAVSDLYYDIDRYGAVDIESLRGPLRGYLEVAAGAEWTHLGSDQKLLAQGWDAWNRVYETVLDLEPENERQSALRDNMLKKIHEIAENRDLREHHARLSLGSVFWAAALVGVVLVSIGYYTFPPKRANLCLISLFAGYTGLILYLIFAMSNPFSDPAALQPVLFLDLLQELNPPTG